MRRHIAATLIATACILSSCGTWRDFNYLQDASEYEIEDISEAAEIRARKGDVINIYVSSRNLDSARPFNLTAAGYSANSEQYSMGAVRTLGYQIDELGDIEFPQLGTIHCEGMTRRELSDYIKSRLIDGDYLKDPIVTIEFQNLKVTVMGEVARPGSYAMNNNHTTLLEALGMAGDLTVYGRRDRVAVIREVDGKRTVVYHDLRSKDIFKSPRYYLQQNDIVIVEANRAKATQSDANRWNQPSVWLSAISTGVSVVTLLRVIMKN